ncbi:hypothetical protein C2W62_22425 [Candidatus Entotheonella serta]|nr:hypothetical protein C2W62_22425 [Candidatus Entotheonella serta]
MINDFLQSIIKQAGEMALTYYRQGITISTKSNPGDLLTEADLAVSSFLVDAIHRQYPTHHIRSEELEDEINPGAPIQWIIDPIDGTRNFANRIPIWCTLIGVLRDGELYLGAIYDAIHDILFFAEAGGGATQNGQPITVNQTDTLAHAYGWFSRGLTLTEPRSLPRERAQLLVTGLTEAVQGFPPLPHVAQEVAAIEKLYDNQSLINETYSRRNIQKRLNEAPYTIVHIASHGEFNSTADDTFILTYDSKLTLDQLDQMIGLLSRREEPIELLTLSACQTAVGDDRAALGLAGIAVKAGARSALATLWYISDEASAELVSTFYQNLQKPLYSRATALRHAHLRILRTWRYCHPAYWAPFLLINNWL